MGLLYLYLYLYPYIDQIAEILSKLTAATSGSRLVVSCHCVSNRHSSVELCWQSFARTYLRLVITEGEGKFERSHPVVY